MNRLVITVLGIVAAVGGSALVFIGVNKLFDLTENRYPLFGALSGGVVSGGVFALLWGNRMIQSPVAVTVAAVLIGAAAGFALGVLQPPAQRLAAGSVGGAALGILLGVSAAETILPSLDPVGIIAGLLIGAGLGFALWILAGRDPGKMLSKGLLGISIGWLFGAWLASELTGSRAEVLVVEVASEVEAQRQQLALGGI